jgi:adenosylhomocysteine nucleosidase
MTKVAMVAALEREVRPLIRNWLVVEREHEGKRFKFFENGANAALVCGGIGEQAARRAAEAVIAHYQPEIVQSVGFAGALNPALAVGDIFSPGRVIDAKDGSNVSLGAGNGVLLSFASIVGAGQKAKLAEAYGAQAIDMEAAAVAKSAGSHGVRFAVTKVISDEFDFEMPFLDRFVSSDGQFVTGRFVGFAVVRPWLWAKVIRLAGRSNKAAKALCRELQRQQDTGLEKMPELDRTLRV